MILFNGQRVATAHDERAKKRARRKGSASGPSWARHAAWQRHGRAWTCAWHGGQEADRFDVGDEKWKPRMGWKKKSEAELGF